MDKFIKELLKEMPEELRELLGIEKENSKKTFREVAKLTPKEFARFLEYRATIDALKAMIESLADLGQEYTKKDKEWWENISDKYNISGKKLKVNREKMTIEEIIYLENVKNKYSN